MVKRALVIGCGIGGPVVAMALQRVGCDATIVEARPGPADDVGAFMNLASNGLDALRAIRADRPVLAAGFPTPRMVMWSGTGKRLGEVPNGLTLPDGTTSITITRGDLHRVLRDEAGARGIPVIFNRRLVDVRQAAGRVEAGFADGSSASADLLIGVDGLHSVTRRHVDPGAPEPRYTGLLSVGGVARGVPLPPTPEVFHMIFGRRGFFGYTVRPSGDAYWFANVPRAEEPAREALRATTAAEWRDVLLERFKDDRGPMAAILPAPQQGLAAYAIHDLPTVPTWHRGRAVIVGDALHASSPSAGQGASLAIEDAVVLARCLRDLADPARAFAAFEALRRERVERVVAFAARIGQTKIPGPLGRRVRDLVLPLVLRRWASPAAHAWIYEHHVDWDAPARPSAILPACTASSARS